MDIGYKRQFSLLKKGIQGYPKPGITQLIELYGKNAYLALVSTLLSLRARDTVTLPVAQKLYQIFPDVSALAEASLEELEEIIRPIGFYRVKALVLKDVARILIERHGGIVPNTQEELLALPGVGRKTANLLLGELFDTPAICVDTHVHRISQHLGWVQTRTPEETEYALMKIFPEDMWIEINRVLVPWGQHVCKSRAQVCVCPKR